MVWSVSSTIVAWSPGLDDFLTVSALEGLIIISILISDWWDKCYWNSLAIIFWFASSWRWKFLMEIGIITKEVEFLDQFLLKVIFDLAPICALDQSISWIMSYFWWKLLKSINISHRRWDFTPTKFKVALINVKLKIWIRRIKKLKSSEVS